MNSDLQQDWGSITLKRRENILIHRIKAACTGARANQFAARGFDCQQSFAHRPKHKSHFGKITSSVQNRCYSFLVLFRDVNETEIS